jgi:hypothetical protein
VPEKRSTKDINNQTVLPRKSSITQCTSDRVVRLLAPARTTDDAAFLSPLISTQDGLWVEYFSIRTGPAISSVLNRSFWSYTLPQLSVSEPAIRHALIALGSAHARFEIGATNNQIVSGAVHPDFVLRHYNQAIRHLKSRLGDDNNSADVVLLCCLLFISLECLYGNRALVVDHLNNGLNILRSSSCQDIEKSSVNANTIPIKQQVLLLFQRLDAQTTLIGRPTSTLFSKKNDIHLITIPGAFKDFEEAKNSLDLLVAASLSLIRTIHDEKHSDGASVSRSARILQIHLLEQFATWDNSMIDLIASLVPFTDDDNRREKSLRVQHTAAFIWLSRCPCLDEIGFDAFTTEFGWIVDWSNMVIAPPLESTNHSLQAGLASLSISGASKFSLDMGFIPPLYLTAIKCRDPRIRREAITILNKTKGREGIWDAHLHAGVSQRLVEVEEATAFLQQGALSAYMERGPLMRMLVDGEPRMLTILPDERARVHDTEIREASEGA